MATDPSSPQSSGTPVPMQTTHISALLPELPTSKWSSSRMAVSFAGSSSSPVRLPVTAVSQDMAATAPWVHSRTPQPSSWSAHHALPYPDDAALATTSKHL